MEPQETVNQNVQEVGFPGGQPPIRKKKPALPALLIIIPIFLLILGALGYFVFQGGSEEEIDATPTPDVQGLVADTPSPEPTLTTTATPSATPQAVDKSQVKVKVLNGTGIPGEAAFLQTNLKSLGYSQIEVGNATETGATATQITYSSSLSQALVDELVSKMKELYKEVDARPIRTTTGFDITITTGPRNTTRAATSTPRVTATPRATTTAKPSATPTKTPTPTP